MGAGEPSLNARSEGPPESWCTHLLREAQADTLKRHCDCSEWRECRCRTVVVSCLRVQLQMSSEHGFLADR